MWNFYVDKLSTYNSTMYGQIPMELSTKREFQKTIQVTVKNLLIIHDKSELTQGKIEGN